MMPRGPMVILIGMRGSGKTTIGRGVAGKLSRTFIDLDMAVLDTFEQPTVRRVWSEFGESVWREAEANAFARILSQQSQMDDDVVLALGGGAPVISGVRDAIIRERAAGRALACYLRCSPEVLIQRLARSESDRPALTPLDAEQELRTVLASRTPIYEALADIKIDVTDDDVERHAAELAREIHRWTFQA